MDHKYPYTDFHELNLDWFLSEFKKLTADWLQLQHDWEDEQQAFQDLHDYVQDYFANLNLYQEVHDVLYSTEMQQTIQLMLTNISASQLPTVIANQIASVVASQLAPVVAAQLPNLLNGMIPSFLPDAVAGEAAAWLADHVDPDTGYVIDDTMLIQNAAADAKAVGDLLDEQSLKTEREIDMVYNDNVDVPLTWTSGEYINEHGNVVANANFAAVEDYIPVYAGTTLLLNCWAGGTSVVCALYDKHKVFDRVVTTQGVSKVFITSDGYIRLSNTPAQIANTDCYLKMYRYENISQLRGLIDNVNNTIFNSFDTVNLSGWSQGYIQTNGSIAQWNAACYTSAMTFSKKVYIVKPKTGYRFQIGQYDQSSGISGFKFVTYQRLTEDFYFFPIEGKYYRFEITKIDQSPLLPANVDTDALSYTMYDLNDNVFITVKSGDSILEAVHKAQQKGIRHITVEDGTYDIIAEYKAYYGATYFDDYTDGYNGFANGRYDAGIYLDNVEIKFSPGAEVVAEYTGNNAYVTSFFAAFACGDNVVIDGLNLKCKNLRYGVHPDFSHSGSDVSYFTLRNSDLDNYRENDSSINNNCAVGAGLPLHGEWLIENCIFRSVTSNRILRIHNNVAADAKSNLTIKNCYMDGNGHIEVNKYGASTRVTNAIVTGCSWINPAQCNYDSPNYSNNNIDMLAFNNETRT